MTKQQAVFIFLFFLSYFLIINSKKAQCKEMRTNKQINYNLYNIHSQIKQYLKPKFKSCMKNILCLEYHSQVSTYLKQKLHLIIESGQLKGEL